MPKVIFTKHALQRMDQRHLAESDIIRVLEKPDYTRPSDEQPDAIVSIRTLNQRKIHVVNKYLRDQHQTLVISTWVRGEEDPTPLSWKIITAPFKLIWWLIKKGLGSKN